MDILLEKINRIGEAALGTITKGLFYSDDETIHERLLFYREAGFISFYGDELSDRTVIRVRGQKSGRNKSTPHRDTRQSTNSKPRLSKRSY